jgi:hypothetical protein
MVKLNKEQRRNAVLLIAAIFLFFLALPYLNLKLDVSGIGATPLVIQQVQYQSSDQFWNTPSYQVVLLADGSGITQTATLSPDRVKELTNGTVTTSKDATITVKVDEYCKYQLKEDTKYIVKSISSRSTTCSNSECWSLNCGGMSNAWGNDGYSSTNTGDCSSAGQCAGRCALWGYKLNPVGVAYELDPFGVPSININISIDYGDGEKNIYLSELKTEDEIPEVIRASFPTSGLGKMDCSGGATTQVVGYYKGNQFLVRSKAYLQQLQIQENQIFNAQTAYTNQGIYQQILDRFEKEDATISSKCPIISATAQTAEIKCQPVVPIAVPILNLYIKADAVGATVPVGEFSITGTKITPPSEAAQFTEVCADIKNDGDSAALDGRLICQKKITPFSSRTYINSGETKTACVNYEASGIIDKTCKLEFNDVNNPSNKVSTNVTVSAFPPCEKPQPSPNMVKVYTEYGCQWVCPNQYTNDIFESNCAVIQNYQRCSYGGTKQVFTGVDSQGKSVYESKPFYDCNSYQGYHCTAENKYMKIDPYLDDVFASPEDKFVPSEKENQVWLGSPYCKYVASYGYTIQNGNAVPISQDYYEYISTQPAAGSETVIAGGNQVVPSENGTTSVPTTQITTNTTTPPADNTMLYYTLGGIAAVIVGYFLLKRKR